MRCFTLAASRESLVNNGLNYLYGKNDYPLNYSKAYACFFEAAKMGSADAMNNIGTMYDAGQYVQRDPRAALEWFSRAVQTDPRHRLSLYNLGRYYFEGFVFKDLGKAFEYYRAAEANGYDEKYNKYAVMQFNMGVILMHHFKYEAESYWHFFRAAKYGNIPEAWHNLGVLAEQGKLPSDTTIGRSKGERLGAAKAYYQRAADLNYAPSMCAIGSLYLRINETERARQCYNRAVSLGYEPARKALKMLNFSQSGSWFDLMK